MSLSTSVRHAELCDLVTLLNRQQTTKIDVVVPASALQARDGFVELSGVGPVVGVGGGGARGGGGPPRDALFRLIRAR
ncbi:hypothetical protein [Nocardia sp. NPDC058497]|uniref:hypothetical protein n=1 Tax=Nocardia sp. NPDC058497 TaxID=3346529 RepID=UPI00365A09CF